MSILGQVVKLKLSLVCRHKYHRDSVPGVAPAVAQDESLPRQSKVADLGWRPLPIE